MKKEIKDLKAGDWIKVITEDYEFRYKIKSADPHQFSDRITFRCSDGSDYAIYISSDECEPCDPPQPESSHDGFKLGKYRLSRGAIVDAIGTNDDLAWCRSDDGVYVTVPLSELNQIAKFDHLRGLAKNKEVIVWDNPDRKKAKRHFSHVSECGNLVYCFVDGKTSFTSDKKTDGFVVNGWDNCEVWEEK